MALEVRKERHSSSAKGGLEVKLRSAFLSSFPRVPLSRRKYIGNLTGTENINNIRFVLF